jgi:hypothetical protein
MYHIVFMAVFCEVFESIGKNELVRVLGLGANIYSRHVEAGKSIAFARSPRAAIQVKKANKAVD